MEEPMLLFAVDNQTLRMFPVDDLTIEQGEGAAKILGWLTDVMYKALIAVSDHGDELRRLARGQEGCGAAGGKRPGDGEDGVLRSPSGSGASEPTEEAHPASEQAQEPVLCVLPGVCFCGRCWREWGRSR